MPGEARSGRESILATADELFYEHGFHAVGVDLIVARAGVAKSTMYRHFPSKDALVATIRDELSVHESVENEVFFPAVREVLRKKDILQEAAECPLLYMTSSIFSSLSRLSL